MSATQLAEQIARKFHAGQKYGDEDYIAHLQEVVAAVQHFFPGDERLVILAWLHDIIEDTEMPIEVLRMLFDGDICDAVIAMTHKKGGGQGDQP